MPANPLLFLASLNGTLAAKDRNGSVTLTGSGAVRYQAASGARTNLFTNPSFETNTTDWAGAFLVREAGGVSGSYCGRVTASTINTGAQTSSGTAQIHPSIVKGQQYVVSFYAKYESGATDWKIGFNERGADGSALGGYTYTDVTISSTGWTRYSQTYTPSQTGVQRLIVAVSRKTAVEGVILVDAFQLETGGTPTDYFDGSTGGAWLDPITGMLGTAHASPSVSQAAAWVEEGTTNTVPDPSFENATITNYWTAQGTAAISKVTTHAYISSNGGKVVCGAATTDGVHQLATSGAAASSGQSWTVSGRIRAFAAGDVGKTVKAAIIERTSGDAVVTTNLGSAITLTDAWQSFSYTVALSGGGTVAKATCGFMAGAAVAVDFVLDAVQLEQKAYATSYCDGSLGTGYAWAGTAHASASTRTATTIIVNETSRISSLSGSVVARMNRLVDSGARQHVFNAGNAGASTDYLMLYVELADQQRIDWRMNNGSAEIVSWGANNVVNTWYDWCADWNGTATGLTLDAGTRVAGTRTTPTTLENASKEMYIGSSNSGGGHLNGGIGPVAIASRPLTAKERAKLYALTSWAWGTLRGGRVGLLVPR